VVAPRATRQRSSTHVRPDSAELHLFAGQAHDVVDGLAGALCLPLGHEQPGQIVPAGEVALDGRDDPTPVSRSRKISPVAMRARARNAWLHFDFAVPFR
jgi:hypothetical protein